MSDNPLNLLFPTNYSPLVSGGDVSIDRPTAGFDPSTLGVIQPQLPQATNAFQSKYFSGNQYEQQLSGPTYNALKAYDQIRVQKGKSPLTSNQTAAVVTAAEQNKAVTPEPERGLIGNIAGDASALFQSIPTLPWALYNTARDIPNIPTKAAEINKQQAGNPLGQLAGYLQLPGVNLVPGSYTASNVLKGDFGEIAKHPLMTALDVLPYANKLAKLSPAVEAARIADTAEAARLTEALGTPVPPRNPSPIKTALLSTVDEAGQPVDNILGRGVSAVQGKLAGTVPGSWAQDAWGTTSRLQSRAIAEANETLSRQLFGDETKYPTNDPAVQWNRDVNKLNDTYAHIDPIRKVEITQLATKPIDELGNPIDVTSQLSNKELPYYYDVKDLTERSTAALTKSDELSEMPWYGSKEVFTPQQASKLQTWDKRVSNFESKYAVRGDRERLLNDLLDPNKHAYEDNPLTFNLKGGDVTVNAAPRENINTQNLYDTLDNLKALRRTDPLASRVVERFKAGDYTSSYKALKQASESKKFIDDIHPSALVELEDIKNAAKEVDSIPKKYNEQNYQKILQKADQARRSVVPARFGEIADELTKRSVKDFINKNPEYVVPDGVESPSVQQYLDYVDQGNYSSLISESGMSKKDIRSIQSEVNQTVADMKQAGVDPIFLHRVTPQQARTLNFPSVTDVEVSPSVLKNRGLDVTPHVPDFQVALKHQGMQFLQREGSNQLVRSLDEAFGRSKADLWSEYLPKAQELQSTNPLIDINATIEKLMAKDGWSAWDVDSAKRWGASKPTLNTIESRMIPSTIKRNFERIHNPSKLSAAIDPLMRTFRTSVLALSPRWLVNNVFGGLFMALGQSDPLMFKNTLEAFRMVKNDTLHDIPGMPERSAFDISPEDSKRVISSLTESQKYESLRKYAVGKQMADMLSSDPASKLLGAYGKVLEKSYFLNSVFDDFYRAATFLREEEKAAGRGLTTKAAQEEGVAAARRVMQNWDEITPLERSVLRTVFPFYGFMQHITRYVLKYPFDHPVRTAVLGSFARNELNDLGTGLPQKLMGMVFLGDKDQMGNQFALNFSGTNPFNAVGDYFTLAGLLGSTNPLISSLAETMGVDVISGGANLYPDTTYDPETGRVIAKQGNYLQTLAGNLLPQVKTLSNVAFDDSKYHELLKTNPQAAGKMLEAGLGLPTVATSVNLPTEVIKAELARTQVQDQIKREGLQSGDYTQWNHYPALTAYLGQLEQLQSQGQLTQYQQQPAQVPNPAVALLATVQGNQPTPVVPSGTQAFNNQISQLS